MPPTTAAWNGRKVGEARAFMARQLPAACGQCGGQVTARDRWVVGHIKARATHPQLTWTPSNWRIEHKKCSDKTGQSVFREKVQRELLDKLGMTHVFSEGTEGEQPPHLPISLPATQINPVTIHESLTWAENVKNSPDWLRPFVEVPENATPPTAMTPVHPEAVGSYGPALIDWAKEQFGLTVRWWQALSLVRILEHREDGTLCWREVVMSLSRRSGKSVVVRLLALWRLIFAPTLFDEQQLIVHSASTLKIAKEPMRYATRWIEQQPHLKVVRNNNSPGVEDTAGDHRWLVVPSDKTAGLDTCLGILDESWAIKPEVVDDDLEPSLLERICSMLVLVSTAHRRATSLMRNRISNALALMEAERVLLLLWCAMPDDDPGDPETHRKASAHWTDDRAEYVARKFAKAAAGEDDPEFDDPDPMEGFKAQYLNIWPLKERHVPGDPITDAATWVGLVEEPAFDLPTGAAIEGWPGEGISLALCWGSTVSVTDHPDLASAVEALQESGYRGSAVVGKSFFDDPALSRTRRKSDTMRTAQAAVEIQRLVTDGSLRHDGGEHLTSQVLAVRTMPGADGPRVVSKGRADAIKAALFAHSQSLLMEKRKGRILVSTV